MDLNRYEFEPFKTSSGQYNVIWPDATQGRVCLGSISISLDGSWGASPNANATAFVFGGFTKGEAVAWLGGRRSERLDPSYR